MPRPPRCRIFSIRDYACAQIAAEIALLIRDRAVLGRTAVLGLIAGKTPLPLYQELIYLHREERLSFQNVVTFNLDEYLGLENAHPAGFRSYMQRNLFDHIDIPPANIHFLSTTVADVRAFAHCANYEAKIARAGGIDYQILGMGRLGEIGFIEPGIPLDCRTHRVLLSERLRQDVAGAFGGIDNVPTHAITMGYGTVLEARKIAVLAWGTVKSRGVRRAIEGPVSSKVGASCLKTHPAAQFFLDGPAASPLQHQ
jgi:glucosamine-6-phosphate deaminase